MIGLISLVGLAFISLIGLDGHIGCNCLIGDVIVVSLGLVFVSLGNVHIEFEIKTKLSQYYRRSWLWCVRRVFSSLAVLDSDFFFFEDALQNATQLFFKSIPQMTKYFIMRECEDIPTGISLCYDSAFAHKMELSIFKFSERFSEMYCRDLTTFALFATLLTTLII